MNRVSIATASPLAVDRYIAKSMPSWLKDEAPVPSTWDGPANEWERVKVEARSTWMANTAFSFAESIAAKGFYPDELVRGELRPGAEVIIGSGVIRRPMPPTHSDLISRAHSLLTIMRSQRLGDSLTIARLEEIARGRAGTDRRRVMVTIEQAERILAAAETEVRQDRLLTEARKSIRVLVPFRSGGGKAWQPGDHKLNGEELERLLDWQAKQEAFASRRGWSIPEGFAVWPPFEVI